MNPSAWLVPVLALAAVASGCVGPSQSAEASFGPFGCSDFSAAQNVPGSFQYGGAVTCKTASEVHNWTNPSPIAIVQWGGAGVVENGSLGVTILDGVGREVYSFTIDSTSAGGAQSQTDPGAPTAPPLSGAWAIEIEFHEFTGAMGLQVSSPP